MQRFAVLVRAAWLGLAFALPALPARADLAIANVTLLDGTGAAPVRDATVVVRGARIDSVVPGGKVPAGMRRIDGTGKFLIPGLMDVHIHLVGTGQWRGLENPPGVAMDFQAGEAALRGYLYFGVTSVYDAGNVPAFIYDLRARERTGKLLSPRIFATGSAISYPGSWMAGDWHGVGAPDWPETAKLLDALVAAKPDMQKLVMERFGIGPNPAGPYLHPDLAAKIIGYLKARGVRTTVHATVEELARAAFDAGVDTFAHPVGLGRQTAEFTRLLAERKTPVATTVAVIDEIVRLGDNPDYLDDPMFRAVFTAEEIAARKAGGGPRYNSLGWTSFFKMVMPYMLENLRKLHEAGGVLALATDRSEGPLVHRELELLAGAGIPPRDLLRIATYNGAVFLSRERDLGSVEPGKLADLVLLDADPTVDVRNYRRIAAVVKDGKVIDRAKLDLPVNRR
jgi:imidazolonepropionase-like amidohydrolase